MAFPLLDLTNCGRGDPVHAKAYVVGVGRGPVLDHDLALDVAARQVLQILQFVDAGVSPPLERRLAQLDRRDALLSRPHPEDGAVVALHGIHIFEVGKFAPRHGLKMEEKGEIFSKSLWQFCWKYIQ